MKSYLFLLPAFFLAGCSCGDSICEANVEASAFFRSPKSPDEIIDFLSDSSRGEAPYSAKLFTFVEWGAEHKEDFDNVINHERADQRFLELMKYAAEQTGQLNEICSGEANKTENMAYICN